MSLITKIGELFEYQVEQKSFTYEITNGPVGLNISYKNGIIYWCPTPDQLGNHTFDVVLQDGAVSLSIQVEHNTEFIHPTNCLFVEPDYNEIDLKLLRGDKQEIHIILLLKLFTLEVVFILNLLYLNV